MFPLGGIQEWNLYSAACFVWLFRSIPVENSQKQYPGGMSIEALSQVPPLLLFFVLVTSYIIPFAALWKPHWFPYGPAMQQYTGNWPAGQVLIRKSAVVKIASRFPTSPPLVEPDSQDCHFRKVDGQPETGIDPEYIAYVFEALNWRRHVTLRAIPHLAEIATRGRLNEYTLLDMRQLLGSYDDDQTTFTDSLLKQLATECKLSEGDLMVIHVSSFPSLTFQFPRTAIWCIRDAAADSKEGVVVARGTVTIDALVAEKGADADGDISWSSCDDLRTPLIGG